MKRKVKFLGVACAMVLGSLMSVAAAKASNFSGNIDATYGHGSNGLNSLWGANGALSYNTGWSGISLEGNVGYTKAEVLGHSWDFGGSLVWSGEKTRLAGSVIHYSNVGFNETTYGVGAQFFPNQSWDFYGQGGGVSGTLSGSYGGGGINWYACPNFAVTGDIHYGSLTVFHETDYSLKGEYLFSSSTPISINAGWQHTNISGLSSNIFFVGLKLYAGQDGASTLADHKHTGALSDISPFHPVAFNF